MIAGDYSTYPKERGQYLLKYKLDGINYYMIAFFWPKGDPMSNWPNEPDPDKFGFFYDENCEKEANIETQWHFQPYAYCYLPEIIGKE